MARRQDGYKAHIAIEPDTGIITDCALSKASGTDNHEAVIAWRCSKVSDQPLRVLGDSAYGTGEARAALAAAGHVAVIKPIPLRYAVPGGFTIDDFTIDFDANTVTCPARHRPDPTKPKRLLRTPLPHMPLASQCTTAVRGRKITIGAHEQLQRAARATGRTRTGRTSTANTGPWWNAPSPG